MSLRVAVFMNGTARPGRFCSVPVSFLSCTRETSANSLAGPKLYDAPRFSALILRSCVAVAMPCALSVVLSAAVLWP
ncbi:hypothetical protein D9M70_614830 [compost metagenome]